MQEFDVIVIGAGPAGSAAAFTAASLGMKTAIVDKSRFPRDKLCGGGITGRSRRLLRDIFERDLDQDSYITRTEVAFSLKGREVGRLHDAPPFHLTMRREFDATLLGWAIEAGAVEFLGASAKQIDTGTNRVTLSNDTALAGKILIGADGVNSQVARDLFGRAFDQQTIGFGLETEVPISALDPKTQPLRIDFDAVEWGYGWVFPKRRSTTVGVGGIHSKNPEMKPAMRAFLDQSGANPDELRTKGHFIPFGDFRKIPGKGAVLLCGDAAGLVDPITGEGIAYAMQSGHFAAQSAAEAIRDNAPHSALRRYQRKLKPIHTALNWANLIRRVIFSAAFRGYFEQSLKRSGTLRWQFMQLLAGEQEYGQIVFGLTRRLPALMWRGLRPGR